MCIRDRRRAHPEAVGSLQDIRWNGQGDQLLNVQQVVLVGWYQYTNHHDGMLRHSKDERHEPEIVAIGPPPRGHQGSLLPINTWAVSPPVAGVSGLA
eukprot:11768936-Prorocentrum_lima.AAC.1